MQPDRTPIPRPSGGFAAIGAAIASIATGVEQEVRNLDPALFSTASTSLRRSSRTASQEWSNASSTEFPFDNTLDLPSAAGVWIATFAWSGEVSYTLDTPPDRLLSFRAIMEGGSGSGALWTDNRQYTLSSDGGTVVASVIGAGIFDNTGSRGPRGVIQFSWPSGAPLTITTDITGSGVLTAARLF